jgi:hypothetical protein
MPIIPSDSAEAVLWSANPPHLKEYAECSYILAVRLPRACSSVFLTGVVDHLISEWACHLSAWARWQTDMDACGTGGGGKELLWRAERAPRWQEVSPAGQAAQLGRRPRRRRPGDKVYRGPIGSADAPPLPYGVYLALDPDLHRGVMVWAMGKDGSVVTEMYVPDDSDLRANAVEFLWRALDSEAGVWRDAMQDHLNDRDDDDEDPPEPWRG